MLAAKPTTRQGKSVLAIDFFDRGVARFPGNALVSDGEASYSYAQMAVMSRQIAARLLREGLAAGDRVAILTANHPMVFACQYGILRARGVCAPVNYRNRPDETLLQAQAQGIGWVFFHSAFADHARLLAERAPSVRRLVCMDEAIAGFDSLEEWLSQEVGPDVEFPEGRPEDPIFILTTSGTTGAPKGVVHTNRSFEAAIANCNIVLPFDAPPRHLVVAPLAHAAGVYHWTLLALGAENILAPSADPELIARMIEEARVSVVFLPPTLIYMVLASDGARRRDYSSLKYVVYGAAPMSVTKLREAVELFGPVMTQFYGQSEALLMATVLTAKDHAEILADPALAHRIAAAGRESPLARVEIMGEAGRLLPPGTEGEIVIRSEILLSHYHENPQATEAARAFGWHHTGDIGIKDTDGYVYVVDRKSDMIVSGAYNLYPGEIEQAVLAHPMIQNCAVVGAPDEKWGEAVLAAVELKPGCSLDESEFLAFCKAKLGSLKAPKRVDVWPSIPRNAAGKTLRREVRARYWQGHDRAI